MDIGKISSESGKVIEYLNGLDLKPDEKIAILETASWTIKSVLGAEVLRLMWANVLEKPGR